MILLHKIRWILINCLLSSDEKYIIYDSLDTTKYLIQKSIIESKIIDKEEMKEDLVCIDNIANQMKRKYFNYHFYKPSIQYYFIK